MKPFWISLSAYLFVAFMPFNSLHAQGYELDWIRSFGNMGDDGGKCVVEDRAKGEIWVVGYTQPPNKIKADFWIIKVNSEGRNLWAKTYGGRKWDEARAAVATEDGGLVVVGVTESKGSGRSDIWLMKLDQGGEMVWERLFGDKRWDEAFALKQTQDGGFIIAGSYTPKRKDDDVWVIRTDPEGKELWSVKSGGEAWDGAHSILELPNGSFLVAGHTASNSMGKDDGWILRISGSGKVEWDRRYGGEKRDALHSLALKSDSTVLVAGFTRSQGHGEADLWLINIDLEGELLWEKTIGGHDFEKGRAMVQTQDGHLLFAGYTHSQGLGGGDAWVVKTSLKGEMLWEKTFGGEGFDKAYHLTEKSDGKVVLVGSIELGGYHNMLLIQLAPLSEGAERAED